MIPPPPDRDEPGDDRPPAERPGGTVRGRILRSTALLPALLTVANGLCGFGAVHWATKAELASLAQANLVISAWLVVAAMVCDMLDGQLARFARRTSDFGAQLDSVCDAISFGVAPAMLLVRCEVFALRRLAALGDLSVDPNVERFIWAVGAAYVACAVLRLARFNVEHDSAQPSHMAFNGLPSPAAAAAIVSVVLLFADLSGRAWPAERALLAALSIALPVLGVLAALLMVSRVRYLHLVNHYIHGHRPFGYIVRLVLVLLAGLLLPFVTFAALTHAYVLSGLVRAVRRRLRRARA
jgi:CDP-diacylglycerol--serine O-phosphatidyltransferase